MNTRHAPIPDSCPWCGETDHQELDGTRLFGCGMQFTPRGGQWGLYFHYPGGQLATFAHHLRAQSEREGFDAPLGTLFPQALPQVLSPQPSLQ